MSNLINKQTAIDLWNKYHPTIAVDAMQYDAELRQLPLAQPTQLTDDDIETIRVHLSAIKENLCNQHRWNEAKEYEALIDRLTAQPEPCEDDPRADVYYLAEKIGIHQLYALVVQLRGEPEPCEDAVSRKAVIDMIGEWKEACADSGHKEAVSDIMLIRKDFIELPSVTPKQRTGKWIKKHRHYGGFRSYTGFDAMGEQHTVTVDERTEYDDLYCSECGARSADNFLNFCPNCGAKMEGASE